MFNLDIRFFFNTVKHMNKHGALIASQTLGRCVVSLLHDKNYQEESFTESIKIVERLERGSEEFIRRENDNQP
jgi:hypothetical protein